jgi:PAT family beta-lactamase induction signal transducer AmpG
MQRFARLALLSSLYFAQGLPFGFFTQFLPVMLRQQGVSLQAIGASYLLALPWSLKFLWAPLVDRYGSPRFGRRRSWIVPIQMVTVVTLAGLSFVDPRGALRVLFASVLLFNLLAATQDIATDGLAVDTLRASERGLGNAIQVAGYRVGMIVGGGLLLPLYELVHWKGTLLAMSVAMAAASVPIVLYRERDTRPSEPEPQDRGPYRQGSPVGRAARGMLRSLTAFGWRRPGIASWVFLLLTYKTGDAIASGMVRPFTVDMGATLGQIGWMLGVLGFAAGLLGAVVGGATVNALGRRRALVGFGLVQALSVAVYALIALSGRASISALAFAATFEHFAGGCATAALFTVMMDACRPSQSATDYTVQSCAVVVATGTASSLSGVLARALGYAGMFTLSSVLCALGVLYVWFAFEGARAKLHAGIEAELAAAQGIEDSRDPREPA